MIRKKEKGFTLVELLAVVTILGILSAIAAASYNKYVKKAKTDWYKQQEKMLTQAGRDFYIDNKGRTPQASGEESCVLLSTLINNKYIGTILDYNKKACNSEESKACIRKVSNNYNIYYSYLNCGSSYTTPSYQAPTVSFDPENGAGLVESALNEDQKVKMKISDRNNDGKENAGIASYRYVIYKDLGTGEDLVYYDSGWKNLKDQTKTSKDVTIKLDSMGTYYVKGWAYNRSGKSASGVSGKVKLTYTFSCKDQIEFNPVGNENTWTNQDVNVTVKQSGAVQSFDVELLNTSVDTNTTSSNAVVTGNITKTKAVTISQNGKNKLKVTCHGLGQTGETTSDYYNIDKIKPTCGFTRTPNNNIATNAANWARDTFTIKAHCNDTGGSTCKQDSGDLIINPNESGFKNIRNANYEVMTIYDKAGNSAVCRNPVYVDAEKPDITFKVYEDDDSSAKEYTNKSPDLRSTAMNSGNVEISISDGNSGVSGYSIKSNGTVKKSGSSSLGKYLLTYTATGTYTIEVMVSDLAGNTRTETLKLKVDSAGPTLNVKCVKKDSCSTNLSRLPSTIENYESHTWSNKCIYCEATSDDSGVSIKNRICGAGAGAGYPLSRCLSWTSGNYKNINADGKSRISFKAEKDNGSSTTSGFIVKIDTKDPSISIRMTKRDNLNDESSISHDTYSNDTWTNKFITMYATTSDDDSGVAKTSFYIKKGSATSKDKQGKWIDGTSRIVNATGESQIKFKVEDNVGNSETTNYYTLKMDRTAPTISSAKANSNNTISFTAKDSLSGVASFCVRKTGGECGTHYVNVSNTAAGEEFNMNGITKTTTDNAPLKSGVNYVVAVKDRAGNVTKSDTLTVPSAEKTYDDITPEYIDYRYATVGNGSNGSSVLYNESMDKTKNEYKDCYNCNTSSWKAGYEYVSMMVSLAKGSNNKKVKITINLKNNVGTYLTASDNKDYIRKVCFTKGRVYNSSTCYGKSVTIKNKEQSWTNGTNASAELDIPQTEGRYAIKIYSPNCNTGCNPYGNGSSSGGACNGYLCKGIAVFQTNYVIQVN